MDEQRALLDQLMGKTRDLDDNAKKRYRGVTFHDRDVCKLALHGFCPYDYFAGTKSNLGSCTKSICTKHSDMPALVHEYSKTSAEDREDFGYEYDYLCELEDLIGKCNARIKRNMRDLEQEWAAEFEGLARSLLRLRQDIADKSSQVEALALTLDLDAAHALATDVGRVKNEHDRLEKAQLGRRRTVVCPVSGNIVDLRDSDERLWSHFEGRQYTGWLRVRDTVDSLKASGCRVPRGGRRGGGGDGGGRDRDRDGYYRDKCRR